MDEWKIRSKAVQILSLSSNRKNNWEGLDRKRNRSGISIDRRPITTAGHRINARERCTCRELRAGAASRSLSRGARCIRARHLASRTPALASSPPRQFSRLHAAHVRVYPRPSFTSNFDRRSTTTCSILFSSSTLTNFSHQ